MTISPDWTPTERLQVIEAKARQVYIILQRNLSPIDQRMAFDLTDEIYRLATDDASFLEQNRKRLLEGIE